MQVYKRIDYNEDKTISSSTFTIVSLDDIRLGTLLTNELNAILLSLNEKPFFRHVLDLRIRKKGENSSGIFMNVRASKTIEIDKNHL